MSSYSYKEVLLYFFQETRRERSPRQTTLLLSLPKEYKAVSTGRNRERGRGAAVLVHPMEPHTRPRKASKEVWSVLSTSTIDESRTCATPRVASTHSSLIRTSQPVIDHDIQHDLCERRHMPRQRWALYPGRPGHHVHLRRDFRPVHEPQICRILLLRALISSSRCTASRELRSFVVRRSSRNYCTRESGCSLELI